MIPLLLATQNQGKIAEIKSILSYLPYTIIIPNDEFDVEETGTTFEENARLKAQAFSEHFGNILVLADDSGLIVDELDGRPGVYSKRYADTDVLRIEKLLKELENVPQSKRTARFVSAMAIFGEGVDEVFFGSVEGHIAMQPQGTEGFGYDPIFIPEGYDQSFAELGQELKNTMSHRARALENVKLYLLQSEERESE